MKQGWKIYEFEKCLEKFPSYNKIPKNKFLIEGNFPIISQEKEFINGYWNDEKDVIEIKKSVVIFGDHTKIVKLIDFNFVAGADGVKIFQPIDEINAEYFAYYLQNIKLDELGYARHYRLLKQINVPIPPLEEQRTIVAKLDQAFAAIDQAKANIENNIANAKELFQSKLVDLFQNYDRTKFEVKTIKEITSLLGDGLHGTPKYNDKGEYYFINGNNLMNEGIVIKPSTKRIDESQYLKYKKDLNENTVLVSINGTLGNVGFYNNEKIVLGKSACYFNLKSDYDKRYIMYQIKCPAFLKYANKEATGATIKNVSLKSMRNFEVVIPKDLKTQQKIVTQLDQLQEQTNILVTKYQQKLANLEELKKSILEKAFKGELL